MVSKASYTPVGNESKGAYTKQRRLYLSWAEDGWIAEIACVAIGILLIIALCVVLRNYDGEPAPRFGEAFGTALTLNTVVAIIATAAKASLLLPVAECVSQQKWFWFERDGRSLEDMSTFDSASRGIWGGFELLWRTKLK